MKKSIMLLFLVLTIQIYGQEPISYEKVIKADGVNKSDLFFMINDWIATKYNSAQDVIQLSDKEKGAIIVKGLIDYYYGEKRTNNSYNGNLAYTLKVYVKDNRYKVIITSVNHEGVSSLGLITSDSLHTIKKGWMKKYNNDAWKNVKLKSWQFANNIFASLEKATSQQNSEIENDEW